MTALRPYQQDSVARIIAEIDIGRTHVLLVAPTGAGKTIIICQLIADYVASGKSVLFLAHRLELIEQASAKLHGLGIDHGIIKAGFAARPSERVQVAAVQTLYARAVTTNRIEMPAADVVIVDEAHHVRARTYKRILAAYPNAIVIGLTATPMRGDGRGLGSVFDVIVETPQIHDLTSAGYLVQAIHFAPARPDLSGVKVQRGDYVELQLAERMNKPHLVADIVVTWLKHNPSDKRRRTVVFATGVAHSLALRDQFRDAGVLAEHIDGTTPAAERAAILKRLAAGEIEVVCNAMVLTEGWDSPSVSCIVLARPTKALGLYRQMVGRVLRPHPGKEYALVLDHAGAVFEHGLIDEPVTWTLREDKRAVNISQTARSMRKAPALTECPECKAVRMEGSPCPACGWRPQPKARPVVVADGELGEVARDRTTRAHAYSAEQKAHWHGALAYIARERGFKSGWTFYKFQEKFGHKPFGDPAPIYPSAEVRAWVKSRQIAYAKAQHRQRGAA